MTVRQLLSNCYSFGDVEICRFDANGEEIFNERKACSDWKKFSDTELDAEISQWAVFNSNIIIEL